MDRKKSKRLKPAIFQLTLRLFFVISLFILGFPRTAQVSSGNPGDLDTSFGSGGIATTEFAYSSNAAAVAIQSDGKIVAVGTTLVRPSPSTEYNDFALARFNTDGSLDSSFGLGGNVTTHIDSVSGGFQSVSIQPDGKILAGGDGIVIRYETNGNRDATFGTGGIVNTASLISPTTYILSSIIALQPDGKILETGREGSQGTSIILLRLNTDGSLDASFGTGGYVTYDWNGFGLNDMTLQSDSKIVLGGLALPTTVPTTSTTTTTGLGPTTTTTTIRTFTGRNSFGVLRYNADGSIDNSFGTSGRVSTDFSGYPLSIINAVRVQSDGKIVAAGSATNCQAFTIYGNCYLYKGQFALARYNPDGSLDSGFGTGGTVLTPFDTNAVTTPPVGARGLAIQADGKLVAVGFTFPSSSMGPLFALARYNVDGSLDSTFGTGGKVTTMFNSGSQANAAALQQDGNIIAAGNTGYSGADHFGVARYRGGPSPIAVSLTPVNITTAPSVAQGFTATYADPGGYMNILDASLSISGNTHNESVHYNPATNKFTLMGASGDCSPGQAATLSDGNLTLNCISSSASGSGNMLTITFNLTPQPLLSGAPYHLMISVVNLGALSDSKTPGTWIVNSRPSADSVSPMNSMTDPGMAQMFTAVYSDPDGWQNIAAANFYLSGNGGVHNEWLHYLVAPNLFTMMGTNDSCSPGQAKMLSSGFLNLDCSSSSISGSGNVLTVVFQVTPQMSSSGLQYNIFTAASDQAGASYAIFAGTWQIQ